MSQMYYPCSFPGCTTQVRFDELHEFKEPGKVGRGEIYCFTHCPRCQKEIKK